MGICASLLLCSAIVSFSLNVVVAVKIAVAAVLFAVVSLRCCCCCSFSFFGLFLLLYFCRHFNVIFVALLSAMRAREREREKVFINYA